MTNSELNPENYANLGRAALLNRTAYNLLRLTGTDRVDFLQRMTTNNMAALRPGQAAVTVLTSPTARVLFVFTVLCQADELWLLPAGPEQTAALNKHLRSQIFFMDKVSVQGNTPPAGEAGASPAAGYIRVRLVGQDAGRLLAAHHPAAGDLGDGQFTTVDGLVVLRQENFDLPGFELLVPASQFDDFTAAWAQAGVPLLDEDTAYLARRIEWGRPAAQAELTDEYNPLEVGLAWTCAENKGCYTGQEIIARQVTYDKVTRTLVGLRSDEPLPVGSTVRAGTRAVGEITSAAYSPGLESHLALAVIRRPHNVAGETVTVVHSAEADAESLVEVSVEGLPFGATPAARPALPVENRA